MKAWKALLPPLIGICIALLPAPAGLAPHAWHYFALFAAVIVALVLEPLPGGAVGLLGLTVAVILAQVRAVQSGAAGQARLQRPQCGPGLGPFRVLEPHGLAHLRGLHVRPGLREDRPGPAHRPRPGEAHGQQHPQPGLRRPGGRPAPRPLHALQHRPQRRAPSSRSSATCRPCTDSKPNDPSMHRIGTYLMWVAIATTCVTSTLFMTALAPNVLAVELVRKTVHVDLQWLQVAVRRPAGLPPAPGRRAPAGLLAGAALGEGRPRGAPVGGGGAGQDGQADR